MRLIAQALVRLPFTLDFCAVGSEAPAIEWQRDGIEFALRFPPSLTEGTCGKSIYPDGWAWWTGERIVIEAGLPIDPAGNDLEALRDRVLREMNQVVRTFLNSYRLRFHRPDIHSVPIDPAVLALVLEHDDGSRESLPDAVDTLSHLSLPAEPPLDSSVNETTIGQFKHDLEGNVEQPVAAQLALDAEWLRSLGEHERASALEKLASGLSHSAATPTN